MVPSNSSGVAALCGFLIVALSLVFTSNASEAIYARAVVESCKGCQLNRLPEIKKFIFEDIPHYENAEFKHIQGAPPELVLYDNLEKEVERIKLVELSRDECNELMVKSGFKSSKPAIKDEI